MRDNIAEFSLIVTAGWPQQQGGVNAIAIGCRVVFEHVLRMA